MTKRRQAVQVRETETEKQVVFALVLLGALAACAGSPHSSPTAASYMQAVRNSAVFDVANVRPLQRVPPEDVMVAVVAWKTLDDAARYYHAGLNTAGVDVWVTAEPELRELCAQFPTNRAALTLRLQQLLGLPAKAESRVFVRIAVPRVAVIRPCPDPDPAKPNCTANFPKSADEHYKSWFAEQMVSRYRLPDGYPWTRLGYTTDWSADPPQIGASEFVIPKDAAFEVTEQVDTVVYCHGSASAY